MGKERNTTIIIEHDPEFHTYTLDGNPVPSVTQVIRPLMRFFGDVEDARDRGTAVHKMLEEWDYGTDRGFTRFGMYRSAWVSFLDDLGATVLHIEEYVAHPILQFAGTFDRIIELPGATRVMVDLKTSAVLEPWIGCQLASYRECWNRAHKKSEHVTRSLAVQLRPDGTYATRGFHDHQGDWGMFVALLTEMRWKEKNGWATE